MIFEHWTDAREREYRAREDRYMQELEQTGYCEELDLTMPQAYYRAWRKWGIAPHPCAGRGVRL